MRVLAFAVFASACAVAGPVEPDGGSPRGDATVPCDSADTDGDGIADPTEGTADPDGDGIPNASDLDSDGDGVSDADEHRAVSACDASDSDGDGVRDIVDRDSDNDGVGDDEEASLGTDPTRVDSDRDGVSDLVETRGTRTDPLDPDSTVDPRDFAVVLPYEEAPVVRTLRFDTDLRRADVFFLIDTTVSMRDERSHLIEGLVDVIIPGIRAAIADVELGIGGVADYPIMPFGAFGVDLPFFVLRPIAPYEQDLGAWSLEASADECPNDLDVRHIGQIAGAPNGRSDLLDAALGVPCHGGGDSPEGYVPALYSLATGEGLTWAGSSIPGHVCPAVEGESEPRRGYPCFRPRAQPIVVLFGDAEFHNSPASTERYNFTDAPLYTDARDALVDLHARVIGIHTAGSPSIHPSYGQLAEDTGAVRADGTPLVFNITPDAEGLDETVVEAIASLATGTPQDVSTRTENAPGNPDDFDARQFIVSIVPDEGYRDDMPGMGYSSKDETTFYAVIPGTEVTFTVTFENLVRPPGPTAEIFQARIYVVGNGVTDLDMRQVFILVPPSGQTILI
jgi:hypothetical protein